MERIKQMSLKKAFFCLTLLFLLFALIFSVLSVWVIGSVLQQYGPSIQIELGGNTLEPQLTTVDGVTLPFWYNGLSILQILLPVLFVMTGLLSADFLFYRIKIKSPLAELQAGAERIMQNDLDFSIQSLSKDELGQLCGAFDAMRRELLKNNKSLWKQMEERKRLNAAFSHDLRNPVTVLKGSAKILKMGLSNGGLTPQNAQDTVSLIAEYAGRIETYIEAMSSVQRLEELQCSPKKTNWEALTTELSDSTHLLTMGSSLTVLKQFEKYEQPVWIDKSILFNIAENLIANAARYAKEKVYIIFSIEDEKAVLSVQDDGAGFPQIILRKGAEPFLWGEESSEKNAHFGMGLYVCRLLCEKHGGSLKLENTSDGALVTVSFRVSKP